jgi:hypothetical protein
MEFSRLPRYPDTSPVRAPWWWRPPRPDQRDWLATGLKALFVFGTLFGAFYLRAGVLTPPADLGRIINAATFDHILEGMTEARVEELFGVAGRPFADPAWLEMHGRPGEQWVKWTDPANPNRWIAVRYFWRERHGDVQGPFVAAKEKSGF